MGLRSFGDTPSSNYSTSVFSVFKKNHLLILAMHSHGLLYLQYRFLLQNLHTLPATPIFKICKPITFSKSQLAQYIYFWILIQIFPAKTLTKNLVLSAVRSPSSAAVTKEFC